MTTQTYRLKIARVNSLKLKVLSKFPADVQVGNFLTLTKENGVYSFGVDYSKLGPGPISDPATAFIAIEDKTAGIYREVSLASLLTSGVDADLQAIAALTGAGILVRTADNTWSLRTVTGTANEITVTNGDGVLGNPTLSLPSALKLPGSLEMTVANFTITGGGGTPLLGAGTGIYVNPNLGQTHVSAETVGGVEGGFAVNDSFGAVYFASWSNHPVILRTNNTDRITVSTAGAIKFNSYAAGTIFADASGNLTAKNAADTKTALGLVPGTDVQAFDADLSAVAGLSTTGLIARTGSGTAAVRTVTAPAAGITVSNGDGVSGNPTLALANDLAALEGLSGTGIARRTGTDAWSVGTAVANSELAAAADGTIKSNISGSTATPSDNTITSVLDKLFGTTQGSVIYRGASTWGSLTPGTSGNFLKTQGAAANPIWDSIPGGGDMLSTNNLSDLTNLVTARSNLGVSNNGHLWGLTLSNNATDAVNDIDIDVGEAADNSNGVLMKLASGITKRLDAAWAVGSGNGGLDTGSIANTTYHVWLIQRSDTGVVDALFSTSATSPTMPANYDRKRRIGSIIRASAAILAFSQEGDEFLLKTSVADASSASQSTTAVLYALTVPAGIKTKAIISSTSIGPGGAGTNYSVYLSSPDQNDEAAVGSSVAGAMTMAIGNYDVKTIGIGWLYIRTNTSSQIRARASAACSSFKIQTYGWVDTRGRLN